MIDNWIAYLKWKQEKENKNEEILDESNVTV